RVRSRRPMVFAGFKPHFSRRALDELSPDEESVGKIFVVERRKKELMAPRRSVGVVHRHTIAGIAAEVLERRVTAAMPHFRDVGIIAERCLSLLDDSLERRPIHRRIYFTRHGLSVSTRRGDS